MKVYDPRDDRIKESDNPALIMAWIISGGKIDRIDKQITSELADYLDEKIEEANVREEEIDG